jgi:glutathione synthase/RimK-type ligase-like ATP-grasp enzyme
MTNRAKRVGLITTDAAFIGDEDADRPFLLEALQRLGVDADDPEWADDSVDWASYDLVIMRSPWDYPERMDEFTPWLERVARLTAVENCPELIRWNLDKRYMRELADLGVPVVATEFFTAIGDIEHRLAAYGDASVVVKPHVSVGSRDTGLFRADDPGAVKLAQEILQADKVVLIQPAIPSVQSAGETAAVFFDGGISHGFVKGPILAAGGGMIGGEYTENVTPVDLNDAQASVAVKAMSAARSIAEAKHFDCPVLEPLYGRVDMVEDNSGRTLVLEVELFEPSFFARFVDGACDRFALAVQKRLELVAEPS